MPFIRLIFAFIMLLTANSIASAINSVPDLELSAKILIEINVASGATPFANGFNSVSCPAATAATRVS